MLPPERGSLEKSVVGDGRGEAASRPYVRLCPALAGGRLAVCVNRRIRPWGERGSTSLAVRLRSPSLSNAEGTALSAWKGASPLRYVRRKL
jgi:hypothetical protein